MKNLITSNEAIKPNKVSLGAINEARTLINPHLLAKQMLIKGESKTEFVDMVSRLGVELDISTNVEENFFKKYIFSAWKLKRMREIEMNLLNKQQVFSPSDYSNFYGNPKKRRIRNLERVRINEEIRDVLLYQLELEKQTVKALKQLREEQARRLNGAPKLNTDIVRSPKG